MFLGMVRRGMLAPVVRRAAVSALEAPSVHLTLVSVLLEGWPRFLRWEATLCRRAQLYGAPLWAVRPLVAGETALRLLEALPLQGHLVGLRLLHVRLRASGEAASRLRLPPFHLGPLLLLAWAAVLLVGADLGSVPPMLLSRLQAAWATTSGCQGGPCCVRS